MGRVSPSAAPQAQDTGVFKSLQPSKPRPELGVAPDLAHALLRPPGSIHGTPKCGPGPQHCSKEEEAGAASAV